MTAPPQEAKIRRGLSYFFSHPDLFLRRTPIRAHCNNSRIVDQIPLIHIQHFRRTGKRPFPAFDIDEQPSLQKIRFRLGIIIQQDHVRRIRSRESFVYGTAKPRFSRKRNQSDLRESLPTSSRLPSVDPLSTTIVSNPGYVCRLRLKRQASINEIR